MDEAKTILLNAADVTGWEFEDMLDVVCDYINEYVGTYGLKSYVAEIVEEEMFDDNFGDEEEEEEDE